MSVYNPPTDVGSVFNPSNFATDDSEITVDYLNANYLKFPVAQGFETFVGTNNQATTDCQQQIDMNGNKITTCANPTAPQDVATKFYVDANVGNPNVVDTNTNAIFYPTFVAGSGVQPVLADITSSPFTYNPSTSEIQAGSYLKAVGSRTAVGQNAGLTSQNVDTTAIGSGAGQISQGTASVAIGFNAGNNTQGGSAVAIGSVAGITTQGLFATAVGAGAGATNQGQRAVAVGVNAGNGNQGERSVAIGEGAGQTSQNINSVAIGNGAGQNTQGASSVAIGNSAGTNNQSNTAVAIGLNAGTSSQGTSCVAVGNGAGQITQSSSATAVGNNAGTTSQGQNATAVGNNAGNNSQGNFAVAVGSGAGQTVQGVNAVAIGISAGTNFQGGASVAIGQSAGFGNQSTNSVAIGFQAGLTSQGTESVAIGFRAGETQGAESIAIGRFAGTANQANECIAIGDNAGGNGQNTRCIAIGQFAGQFGQQSDAVAIGDFAGYAVQSSGAIAIGKDAGRGAPAFPPPTTNRQGVNAVAIGNASGQNTQGANAVAIGNNAGNTSQGVDAIAIGNLAGQTSQPANSIALNASGVALNPATASAFYVNPVRYTDVLPLYSLYINPNTSEITEYLTTDNASTEDFLGNASATELGSVIGFVETNNGNANSSLYTGLFHAGIASGALGRRGFINMSSGTNATTGAKLLSKQFSYGNISKLIFGFCPCSNELPSITPVPAGNIFQAIGLSSTQNTQSNQTADTVIWRLSSTTATIPAWQFVINNVVQETLSLNSGDMTARWCRATFDIVNTNSTTSTIQSTWTDLTTGLSYTTAVYTLTAGSGFPNPINAQNTVGIYMNSSTNNATDKNLLIDYVRIEQNQSTNPIFPINFGVSQTTGR